MMRQRIEYSLVPTRVVIPVTLVVPNGSVHSVRAGEQFVPLGRIT